MDIKLLGFSLLALILLSGCPSDNCGDVSNYEFELLIKYSPLKDTFQLGDTIRIQSLISDELLDLRSQENIKVEDFSFFTAIGLNKIEDEDFVQLAFESDWISNINVDYQTIVYSDGGHGVLIDKHNYNDNQYEFSFNLVLKKEGLFFLTNSSDWGIGSTNNQLFDGQCRNDNISAKYKVNNGDAFENNYDLVKDRPPLETLTSVNFNNGGGLAFYVKE